MFQTTDQNLHNPLNMVMFHRFLYVYHVGYISIVIPWCHGYPATPRAKVPKMQPASTGNRRPVTNRGCPRGNGTMESPDLKDDNGVHQPCCGFSVDAYIYISYYIYIELVYERQVGENQYLRLRIGFMDILSKLSAFINQRRQLREHNLL